MLNIFITQGFQAIVLIFIVLFTNFLPTSSVCQTLEPTGTSKSVLYLIHGGNLFWFRYPNRVQVLHILALLVRIDPINSK